MEYTNMFGIAVFLAVALGVAALVIIATVRSR